MCLHRWCHRAWIFMHSQYPSTQARISERRSVQAGFSQMQHSHVLFLTVNWTKTRKVSLHVPEEFQEKERKSEDRFRFVSNLTVSPFVAVAQYWTYNRGQIQWLVNWKNLEAPSFWNGFCIAVTQLVACMCCSLAENEVTSKQVEVDSTQNFLPQAFMTE